MPGLDGTGPMGMGPMTGWGRGFCSPWGIGASTRAYGVPRWWGIGRYPPRLWRWTAFWAMPFAAPLRREQELSFLRQQATALRAALNTIRARLEELTITEMK